MGASMERLDRPGRSEGGIGRRRNSQWKHRASRSDARAPSHPRKNNPFFLALTSQHEIDQFQTQAFPLLALVDVEVEETERLQLLAPISGFVVEKEILDADFQKAQNPSHLVLRRRRRIAQDVQMLTAEFKSDDWGGGVAGGQEEEGVIRRGMVVREGCGRRGMGREGDDRSG